MSFVTVEGRRIGTKATAKPYHGRAEQRHRVKATIGSQKLLDAILRAKGLAAPAQKAKPAKLTRKAVHEPGKCPFCGSPKQPLGMLIAHIQAAVSSYYGLHPSAMTSARKGRDIAHPRQIAMFLSSELTDKSLPEIGRRFGNRDHTTVMWAVKAVQKRIATDPETAIDVAALREALAA